MDKKKVFIILGVSTLVVGLGVYFVLRNNRFVPTPESVYDPIEIQIDSSMINEPDDTGDQEPLPSKEVAFNWNDDYSMDEFYFDDDYNMNQFYFDEQLFQV